MLVVNSEASQIGGCVCVALSRVNELNVMCVSISNFVSSSLDFIFIIICGHNIKTDQKPKLNINPWITFYDVFMNVSHIIVNI